MEWIIKIFVFLAMIFLHIMNDFNMQGRFFKLKRKQYWEEQFVHAKDPYAEFYMYRNDYKACIIAHSFSWAFLVELPVIAYALWKNNLIMSIIYIASILVNTVIHSAIDNLKDNEYKISLTVDQQLHFCQVLLTWAIAFIFA